MTAPFVYVGCGTERGDLLLFTLDEATGALEERGRAAVGSSTSFAAVHPSGRFLYATQNRADRLSAFAIDPATGALGPLGEVAVAGAEGANAAGPAYLQVDGSGRFLLAANYRGHNVVVHALEPDGRIGARVATRADGTHAHAVRTDPSNHFAFVPYLGADLVAQYRFDPVTGALTPNEPAALPTAAGAGPRHLDFHPNGRWAYLVNELDGTVAALAIDPHAGTLASLQTISALPSGWTGRRWSSDLHVAPSGRFLYVANRAHESLAIFSIDGASGRLGPPRHVEVRGQTPRGFSLTPDGRFLLVANQDSANVTVFAADVASGALSFRHERAVCGSPYFVVIVPRA